MGAGSDARPMADRPSALVWLGRAEDLEEWRNRIERGVVVIAALTRLEIGYAARTANDHERAFDEPPVRAMPVLYATPRVEDRALEVQQLLARRGQHRAPSIPDLVIAATAEANRLTVLHVDKDFDLIAEVTGQQVERLALRDVR